jgi:ABC-type transport system involved in Fe-S cluster assembly fused permease/ATPase subunit
MFLVLASKGLAIASPWFLKGVVDGMALGTAVDLKLAFYGIGAFGATRLLSNFLSEWRMWQVNKIIQKATKRISFNAFTHLHNLDIDFHKTSSKNTVFAINRAMRSIESAGRFAFGFFTPVAVEFLMLCGMLHFYCGPKYLLNMLITLTFYTYFTKVVSTTRRV